MHNKKRMANVGLDTRKAEGAIVKFSRALGARTHAREYISAARSFAERSSNFQTIPFSFSRPANLFIASARTCDEQISSENNTEYSPAREKTRGVSVYLSRNFPVPGKRSYGKSSRRGRESAQLSRANICNPCLRDFRLVFRGRRGFLFLCGECRATESFH